MGITIEADIKNGMIVGPNAAKFPRYARVRITLLTQPTKTQPDWDCIKGQLGKLKTRVDTVAWQQQIRSEWD